MLSCTSRIDVTLDFKLRKMGFFDGKDKEYKLRKEIDYSKQSLTALPKDFKLSTQLQRLNCSNNKLGALPADLGTPSYKHVLYLKMHLFIYVILIFPKIRFRHSQLKFQNQSLQLMHVIESFNNYNPYKQKTDCSLLDYQKL